jgi:catechol 2,3-dioxygenase-like lactoylglutathione lyase family enzyme
MTTTSVDSVANRTPCGATDVVKFHVSLNVADLPRSLVFYSAMFGVGPAKSFGNYAKFEIASPPLILSLKPQAAHRGGPLNHLGLRVTTVLELAEVQRRLEEAGFRGARQDDVRCCYAHQTKMWIADPDETLWELYVLHGDHDTFGEGNKIALALPSLRAFGFFGSIRRWWSKPGKLFGRRACAAPSQPTEGTTPP